MNVDRNKNMADSGYSSVVQSGSSSHQGSKSPSKIFKD